MISEYDFAKTDMARGIPLEIPGGYHVLWQFTTQAAYTYHLKITDGTGQKIYCDQTRTSTDLNPILTGQFTTQSDQTVLIIDVPQSSRIDFRCSDLEIKKEDVITKSYTFLAEDDGDADYNDLLLHITAWRTLGSERQEKE